MNEAQTRFNKIDPKLRDAGRCGCYRAQQRKFSFKLMHSGTAPFVLDVLLRGAIHFKISYSTAIFLCKISRFTIFLCIFACRI